MAFFVERPQKGPAPEIPCDIDERQQWVESAYCVSAFWQAAGSRRGEGTGRCHPFPEIPFSHSANTRTSTESGTVALKISMKLRRMVGDLFAELFDLRLDRFLELRGLWFQALLDGLYPGFLA